MEGQQASSIEQSQVFHPKEKQCQHVSILRSFDGLQQTPNRASFYY